MHKTGLGLVLTVLITVSLFQPGLGNNIQVSTATLTGLNTSQDYVQVQFNLSWENSFRDDSNWDAAWVFVKYQIQGASEWQHAWLNTAPTNQTIPTGYTCSVGQTMISAVSRGMGVFIYRSANGSGNTALTSVQLRWDYGTNGIADGTVVNVKVFAVEMVYVPQGVFYLGDADADVGVCFYKYGTSGPFQVTGEEALNMGQVNNYLWSQNYIEAGSLAAAFPKGFNDFYCMKYELSQAQWVEFFNNLNDAQKTTRDISASPGKASDAVSYRNTVSWTAGDATCTRPDRACNYLSWADGAAYADWAGLRPMTELEYEKACRGPACVDDEFPWGTTSIGYAGIISGSEDGTEVITNTGANCCYNNPVFAQGDGGQGPLRCGIFAKAATSREQSGSSYYGVMELAGNVLEQVVQIYHAEGRAFTGLHGDGILDSRGFANVDYWPTYNAVGSCSKGGAWDTAQITALRTADRSTLSLRGDPRTNQFGFRCVRTAP